ncbi:hypothetical protein N7454_002405 [Penicillium verhagenii]|nr:hypothetical protein N7454_002405 [Penicillium verhagenii]
MPHKHKRREHDASQFDLPPSMIAKALPVREQGPKMNKTFKKGAKPTPKPNNGQKPPSGPATFRRKGTMEDDTPKAFQRLMQFRTTGRRAPSGLETGEKKENKKRKREGNADAKNGPQKKTATTVSEQQAASSATDTKKTMPKILPGEKLADFAARVDRSLPLSEMTKSAKSGVPGMRNHKITKHEKHLRRLQEGWRKDEAKLKEKEQAEREEREFEMGDQLELLNEWEREMRGGKKKKNIVKKKAGDAGSDDDDPDPWAKLKKRDKERQTNPFEVAHAPPTLAKPREIFKIRGGAKVDVANVPNAVGSLRRREELAGERRNIVEEYRRLMAERRGN